VIVSYTPCDWQGAKQAGQLGHETVCCQEPGRQNRWYRPPPRPEICRDAALPDTSSYEVQEYERRKRGLR
jgi:hypothetical protein